MTTNVETIKMLYSSRSRDRRGWEDYLVQLVYNDKRVKRYFHLRMWICVSNAFDARRITKEVVESASFGRHCETSNWDMLQRSLKEKLMLKRFLLVLDDVWSDDQVQWRICWHL
uniref:NB-ARC domain-containing protein n=1 Tax=Ananas comosus var. bracteatus TaxID=296719 RepID=A0A6V7PDU2_ANACO|nr:unnamed protein product [Ananas comosus var. bracteatus]